MPAGDNDLGVEFDELIRDRFLLGSPDEVAGQILRLHQQTGINHLIMSVQWLGMPQSLALDELHMLAEEVFPRVRRAPPPPERDTGACPPPPPAPGRPSAR